MAHEHEHNHYHGHGHAHHGHAHGHGHGHTHGVVDPTIAATDQGIWAIKWSFVGLLLTALLQLAVVFLSGSVGLLADTIHNFGSTAKDAVETVIVDEENWHSHLPPIDRDASGVDTVIGPSGSFSRSRFPASHLGPSIDQ